MIHEIRLAHASPEDLERDHQENLRKGRAFVATGAGGPCERERCRLLVVHPATGATHALEAEVVWVKADAPGAGVGVQLVGFDDAAREELARFVAGAPAPPPPLEEESERDDGPAPPRNVFERVRALNIGDRGTVARTGTLPERLALERTFGSSVWEALLQNPLLSPPEVARIAKNGTITKPLVQVIVANAVWLAIPEVQRALLGNPRVAGPHLERVVRAVPRGDLTRLSQSSAYRAEVRAIAAKLAKTR